MDGVHFDSVSIPQARFSISGARHLKERLLMVVNKKSIQFYGFD
jgi:hypothetical protein